MAYIVSDEFKAAVKEPIIRPVIKVEVLDPVSRAVIRTVEGIEDGSVSVDTSRGTRRTFQLRLVNDQGQWTPAAYSDPFWMNSVIRLWRGLTIFDGWSWLDELVPLGTFLVDRPEVFVDKNSSLITIDGSDYWKFIATGGFPSSQTFSIGTHVNTIIAEVVFASGIEPRWLALDPLDDRDTYSKTIQKEVVWEMGDSRTDFLTNLAVQFGLELFFDPMGLLVSRTLADPELSPAVWQFTAGEDAIMLGLTRTWNDLKLINHIVVVGESTEGTPSNARYEKRDNNPMSPTYYKRIGDRVMTYTAPLISSNAQARLVAEKLWRENALIEEDIKLPTLCLPQIEGNDVIEVVERAWSKTSSRYLVNRFDVPLRESSMTIETKRARAL
jgi:hypothetical protein